MFVSVRRYDGCKDPHELDRRIAAHVLPTIRAMPGFRSYTTVNLGDGAVMAINIFDTRANAEAATATAAGQVRQHLADLLPNPPTVTIGDAMSIYTP